MSARESGHEETLLTMISGAKRKHTGERKDAEVSMNSSSLLMEIRNEESKLEESSGSKSVGETLVMARSVPKIYPKPSTKSGRHVCTTCNYQTNRADNLRKHLLIHSEERPEKCKICGLGFKDRSNCLAHTKLVHSEDRPHTCTVCGKGFKTPKHLRQHEHIHDPAGKPHKCQYCSYASVNKCVLREHVAMVHLGQSKFTCVVCGKSIKSKSSLEYHLNIHRKESSQVKALKEENIEHVKTIIELKSALAKSQTIIQKKALALLSKELKGDLESIIDFSPASAVESADEPQSKRARTVE